MKIYTFNALGNTPVELLWPLRPKNRDKAFEKLIAETSLVEVNSLKDCDIAIYPHKAFSPQDLTFNSSVYDAVQKAQNFDKPLIIDATCDSDVPLNIPTANILRFGLYRSLKQSFETERPYWSNQKTKADLESLAILPRSQKPRISFCGTTSSLGKWFKIGKALPMPLIKTVLSQGKTSRMFHIRVQKGMSHKVRETAVKLLEADTRIDSYFDITNALPDYYHPDNIYREKLENMFVENISKCDYALCVRANGNYSGRFYMALNAGRIPVVIDTDVTIPFENKLHLVKVPVTALDNIGDFILEHFARTSDRDFIEMKKQNREAYNQFLAPEKFIPSYLTKCASLTGKALSLV